MKKILIAEDDALIRDVLKEHLEMEGYEVVLAVDGREAVALTKSGKPDLVIMDIFMPEMDGWEATRHIKSDEATERTRIICLSAYASPEYTEKSVAVHCDLLLTKPIYPDVLKKHIRALLGEEQKTEE